MLCCDVSFLTSICVNNYLSLRKVALFKCVKFETNQWFLALKLIQDHANFVFGEVSLDCRLSLLEYFF